MPKKGIERKEHEINADEHWNEVMDLAQKYGFITAAYGGTVTLVTHQNQLEYYSLDEYLRIQRMNGHCAKDAGYDRCYEGCRCDDCELKK